MRRLVARERIELFFEKVDYLLSGIPVDVRVRKGNWYGGQSHGINRVIDLNIPVASDVDPIAKGLNYHELSHILYSPASSTNKIWNTLEDGRIENIFVRKYPSAKTYFEETVLRLIIERQKAGGPRAMPEDFLLLYHRRTYLDRPYHKPFEKLFEQKYGTERTEQAKRILDDYLLVPGKTAEDVAKMRALVDELASVLGEGRMFESQLQVRRSVASDEPDPLAEKSPYGDMGVQDSDEELENIKDDLENEESSDEEDFDWSPLEDTGPEEESEDESNEDVGGPDGEPEEAEDESEGTGSGELPESEPEEEPEDTKTGDGAGDRGSGDEGEQQVEPEGESAEPEPPEVGTQPGDDLSKALAEMRRQHEDLTAQHEIQAAMDAEVARDIDIYPDSRRVGQIMENLLRNYRIGNEPQLERFKRSGGFDLKAAMRPERRVDVFQKLTDYSVGLDFNLVVLLDTSGSMRNKVLGHRTLADVSRDVTYGVVKACEKYNCPTKVVQFESAHRTVKEFGQTEEWSIQGKGQLGGGTNLGSPLKLAWDELKRTKAANGKHGVLVIVSDSFWDCECPDHVEKPWVAQWKRDHPGLCSHCQTPCTKETPCTTGWCVCLNRAPVCSSFPEMEREGFTVAPLVFASGGTTHGAKAGRMVRPDLSDLHLQLKAVLDRVENSLLRGYA